MIAKFKFDATVAGYYPENAYALALAADLAYEKNEATARATLQSWGLTGAEFFDCNDTQAFLAGNGQIAILAFRGTEPDELKDWVTDAEFAQVSHPWGQVHAGFDLALEQVWAKISAALPAFLAQGQTLWITGHSLGAALAALAVARLLQADKAVHGLYTFGQPRTGDEEFTQAFDSRFKNRAFRFVNKEDIVTRVPPRALNYSHLGTYLYLDSNGNVNKDESNWARFLDCVKVAIEDFVEKFDFDAVADHSMTHGYVPKMAKNRNVNPF